MCLPGPAGPITTVSTNSYITHARMLATTANDNLEMWRSVDGKTLDRFILAGVQTGDMLALHNRLAGWAGRGSLYRYVLDRGVAWYMEIVPNAMNR